MPALRLERRDLILFEHRLRNAIAAFLPFAAYSLYFPGDGQSREVEYIGREKRLLLPLHAPSAKLFDRMEPGILLAEGDEDKPPVRKAPAQGELLGLFVARGVPVASYKALASQLPAIAAMVMDNLFLYKAALCDSVTGLFSREHFLDKLSHEVSGTSEALCSQIGALSPHAASLRGAADFDLAPSAAHSCCGVLVIRLHGLRQIVRKHGYMAADRIMTLLGEALRDICPEQGLTARVSDYELAVLVPAATAKRCRRLGQSIVERVEGVAIPHELTRSRIRTGAAVGYAMYPQDVSGNIFLKSAEEQSRIMLRKARLAAALAAEKDIPGTGGPVLGFGRILAEGGRIMDVLPLSRVTVNVGSAVNAREGQRFSVWPQARSGGGGGAEGGGSDYKGEIVLLDVQENGATAEIIHQGDPAWGMEPGDMLLLLAEDVWGASRAVQGTPFASHDEDARRDPLTALLRHGDFLANWSVEREKREAFSLALVRLAPPLRDGGNGGSETAMAAKPEQLMGEAVRLCRDVFGSDLLGGRYGQTSMIFYHPGVLPETLQEHYGELAALLTAKLFPGAGPRAVAVGVAGYPCLNFRKADVFENCRKALEYGILLPAPHVGVFDSLAITISADKRFSHGDILGAMTEYKQAVLADEGNALAWNSLGVSLARLGRHDEARGYFDMAIERDPQDAMTLYNMGYSCQCLGESMDAAAYYTRCLEKDAGHVYALVRLGQLAENRANYDEARALYIKAGELPDGGALTKRYLAGLALRSGNADEAREYLHEALSLDPNNAVALQMLAGIYLDGGEDAAVAEALARQSVALRPGLKSGWLVLARALEGVGRMKDAREARVRAGEL